MRGPAEGVPVRELIIGGARSGKSRLAAERARASGLPVRFIATATAGDDEMAERIRRHRAERPADWRTVEVGRDLGAALADAARPGCCVVVDCLTLWLGGLIDAPEALDSASAAFLAALADADGEIILVTNEVGQGVVPDNACARRFRDAAGRLHQAVAARCERVTLVTAGLPLTLKGDR